MIGYILAALFFGLWQWDVRRLRRECDKMLGRVEMMERVVKRMDEIRSPPETSTQLQPRDSRHRIVAPGAHTTTSQLGGRE